jgi:phage-related protein
MTYNDKVRVKFYLTGSGRSPIEEFIQDLSEELRGEFYDAVSLLTAGQILAMPLSRNLSSVHPGLHELRFKDRSGQARIFYFVKRGDAIYLLHAFWKKTQEIPHKELELIKKRIKEI